MSLFFPERQKVIMAECPFFFFKVIHVSSYPYQRWRPTWQDSEKSCFLAQKTNSCKQYLTLRHALTNFLTKNAFKQIDSPRNHWLGHVPHVVCGLHTWKRQCRVSKKVFLSCNAKHSGYSLTRHKPICVIWTLLFPCMKKKETNILCLSPSKLLSDFSQGQNFKDKEKGFYLLFFLRCHPCNIG